MHCHFGPNIDQWHRYARRRRCRQAPARQQQTPIHNKQIKKQKDLKSKWLTPHAQYQSQAEGGQGWQHHGKGCDKGGKKGKKREEMMEWRMLIKGAKRNQVRTHVVDSAPGEEGVIHQRVMEHRARNKITYSSNIWIQRWGESNGDDRNRTPKRNTVVPKPKWQQRRKGWIPGGLTLHTVLHTVEISSSGNAPTLQ